MPLFNQVSHSMTSTIKTAPEPAEREFSIATIASVAIAIVIVLITLGLIGFYLINEKSLTNEVLDQQQNNATKIATELENALFAARQLANTTATLVSPMHQQIDIEILMRRLLDSSSTESIYGVGVWYEPFAFSREDRYFGPYLHRGGIENAPPVLTYDWTTPEYDFHHQGWYLAGKNGNGETIFTPPYYDTGLVYMSIARSFVDAGGEFEGVVTVDMVLPTLEEIVRSANLGANEQIYVVTNDGKIFIHPQQDALMEFARSRGEDPQSILDLNESELSAFYEEASPGERIDVSTNVSLVDWTVHIVAPESVVLSSVYQLRTLIIALIAVLWALLAISLLVLRRIDQQIRRSRQQRRALEAEILERTHTEATLQQVNEILEAKVLERTEELVRAKDAAERADQVKSAFLASMSHELRTPLNSVINFSKFVAKGVMGPVNQRQEEALNKVIGSGKHLLDLINDVLDMSKIESGSLALFVEDNVDLNDVLNQVEATAQGLVGEKRVTLEMDVEPMPPVIGDRQRILQILLNIVSNACKFTDEGTIRIQARAQDDEVVITVKDSGPGIAPEDQVSVFEAFKQTTTGLRHGGGTGLGMPISKSLVAAHGGRLWLESEPGNGSTFFVALPVKSEALAAMVLQV
jgi:signal transduction histidine kinase